MTRQRAQGPVSGAGSADDAIEALILPREHDLGGLVVRRALPSAQRRAVGPFVFLDQIGPALLPPGQGLDVRPHPHIGLATLTWLVEGALVHRDSLGEVQLIRPGEVNWMTAGGGIVHSERSPPQERSGEARIYGVQSWVALPRAQEERAPAFTHYPSSALPVGRFEGVRVALLAGAAWGLRSPVQVFSETLYADLRLAPDSHLQLPDELPERAIYVLEGQVTAAGSQVDPGRLAIFKAGRPISLRAERSSHLMVLGGAALDGPRHIWWNFVSSSRERIERAKRDWREGRFAPVPGESDSMPLPD